MHAAASGCKTFFVCREAIQDLELSWHKAGGESINLYVVLMPISLYDANRFVPSSELLMVLTLCRLTFQRLPRT